MASLASAILSFPLRENNVFIAAFYGKIIFGLLQEDCFHKDLSVIVENFQIVDFYCILIKLLHSVNGPYPSNKMEFSTSTATYYWQVKSPTNLVIGLNQDNEISFTSNGFNDFLECFAKLIFPCLALKEQEKFMLHFAAQLTPTEIVQLNDISCALQFINQIKSTCGISTLDQYNSYLLLTRYRDLILIQKKLMSIFTTNECDKRIEILLKTN